MFKIGEFSKICLVSAKALRHWDDVGLLQPAQVDRETGYRYYSIEQLYEVNRILALQAMGLSLKQIRDLMTDQISTDEIRGMFKRKQAELQQEVANAQARLKMLEARLNYMDAGEPLQEFEVVLKGVDALPMVAMRRTYPTMQSFVAVLLAVYQAWRTRAEQENWAYTAVFHDPVYQQEGFTVALGYTMQTVTVDELHAGENIILSKTQLPPVALMATTVHRGSWVKLSEGYNTLGRWINDHGYKICGAGREIFHRIDLMSDGEDSITELQFPIA